MGPGWSRECARLSRAAVFRVYGILQSETKDLDENMVMDLDREGNVCVLTIEHTSQGTDIN